MPLELIDDELKNEELKFWKDHGEDLDADSFTFMSPKNYSSLYIEGEKSFDSKYTFLKFDLQLC